MDDTPFSSAEEDANALRKRDAPRAADPHDFGGAEEALNDAARRVNAVWISFILLCVYIFIATFTVTPAALFRDAPVRLPIFNAELPLKVYFVMAPVLVLALHAYLIVLTKGLTEKIDAYEDALKRSVKIASSRSELRARLDNSIVVRAMSAQYRAARTAVDYSCGFIAGLTMIFMPVALLLLTQLVFLPYHHEWMTRFHRGFVIVDGAFCLWLLWPVTPWRVMARRSLVLTFILFAFATSVFLAAFPGEWMYEALAKTPAHGATVWAFEGPPDPVDYVHKGGVLPFPNRMILPDDPKLAENAGASSGGVSLSVRGRNFRKAVFDRSNLARVDFSAADLTEASLQGAKLEGAKFDCAESDVFFKRGTPTGTPEEGRDCTNLEYALLIITTLDGASFRGARMSGAMLHGATVNRANFARAVLRDAHFEYAAGDAANFSGAQLTTADFSKARLRTANFNGARLQGAGLGEADLSAANFSSALLMGANFQKAQLRAANFASAGLQGARLSYSDLYAATFSDAHMQGVDMSGASLVGAYFEHTFLHAATFFGANIKGASFEGAALPNASLECAEFFRTHFENSNRDQTIVTARIARKCETGWYDTVYYPDYTKEYPYTKEYHKRARAQYDTQTDALPKVPDYGYSYVDSFTPYIYTDPEKLDLKTFERQLNDFVISGLPDEEAKQRVRERFERLKPDPRKKAHDAAEKAFWTEWAKKSAPPESHDKALAERLEAIACVAEGAPYVARGLLRAGRFDRLYENKETNEKERARILERLRKASGGGGDDCPGARGLVEKDFTKPAP